MNIIRRYLILIFTSISLLFGIQIPNFLDQYEKRIDAHLQEVSRNLSDYQKIATKHHANSLHSLIAFHKISAVETFRAEGFVIEEMYNRKLRFEADKLSMNSGLLWNTVHAITDGDNELLQETLDNYSYAVPLNQDAIVSGVGMAMITTFSIEGIFGLLGALVRKIIFRKRNLAKYKLITKA